MPDQLAPASFIFNSLASGEVSPALYGRTDLAKFHSGAFTMRNFFVDYKGGAKTRPGTQFIGFASNPGYVRLYPFKFSAAVGQTYMLVFTDHLVEFIKNPGGPAYPNSSNAGFIFISPGTRYAVTTPYAVADLPALKFSQLADILTIVHPSYPRYQLNRLSDTNWTLNPEMDTVPIVASGIGSITISGLPAGSTDPQNTYYAYAVAAVDALGNESAPCRTAISGAGIDIGATMGSVSVFWSPVAGAAYYKIYKGLPSSGNIPPFSTPLGFAGFVYGTNFVDANVVPDFTKTPLLHNDPFSTGQISGYTITSPGSGWPVGLTLMNVTTFAGDPAPTTTAIIYPVLDTSTPGATGGIVGLDIVDPGQGYLHPPTLSPYVLSGSPGSGFAGTVTLGPSSGVYPGVAGLFQQRAIYADSNNQPNTLWGSRDGTANDFRVSNPVVDSDSFEFTIASPQVNRILWLQSMPGGMLIGTDSGIVQLSGGGVSPANPLAVTPTSGVIVPQSYFGSADVPPIVVNYNVLYVQSEGAIVRDLQYMFYFNIYTGTDITQLSTHLFYPQTINAWAYQDTPNKVVWTIRSDGALLSLTYLKEQEIAGWAQHSTQGLYESIAVVQEGAMDAVYVSVNRNGQRYIERFADQVYYTVEDAWCLDAALSTASTYPAASITYSGSSGTITVTASAAVFSTANVGSVIRAWTVKMVITGYVSPTQVTANVVPGYETGGVAGTGQGVWRMDPVVSTVSGLAHLNGYSVMALADGQVQGPFTVSGGAITLTTPASQVVVGLSFVAQVQPVYADLGQEAGTIQGRRKKAAAATIRVKDTARIKFGTDFANLREWEFGTAGTDAVDPLPYIRPGLYTGDQRMTLNQVFNRLGTVAIQQDYPLPATVLAVIPELAQGDTR
jgi:hypothetical protein